MCGRKNNHALKRGAPGSCRGKKRINTECGWKKIHTNKRDGGCTENAKGDEKINRVK